jgi:hypothetical protein
VNWPLVFMVGWPLLGVIVCGFLYLDERRREAKERAEFRKVQEFRKVHEAFEDVVREMVIEECEYRAKVEAAIWN